MRWSAVVVTVRHRRDEETGGPTVREVQNELDVLLLSGVVDAELVLAVEDPCEDVGSAGSLINALLIVCERLCARRGLSILTEDVLGEARVLVVPMPSVTYSGCWSSLFLPLEWRESERGHAVADTPLWRMARQIDSLSPSSPGVWFAGSDAYWEGSKPFSALSLAQDRMTVFTAKMDREGYAQHGGYTIDGEGMVTSISYGSGVEAGKEKEQGNGKKNLVMALIYMPPRVGGKVLSLHSVHPISCSTYHGVDNGAVGMKLSVFFDLVLATCMEREEYMETRIGCEKTETNLCLLRCARREIHRRLGGSRTKAELVSLCLFHYWTASPSCLSLFRERHCWGGEAGHPLSLNYPPIHDGSTWDEKSISFLLALSRKLWQNIEKRKPIMPQIRTAVAMNGALDMWMAIEQFSLALPSPLLPRCLTALASLLSEWSGGEGGLRMGPAANPRFTPAISQIKSGDVTSGVRSLLKETRLHWMHTPFHMVRAARHVEAAAQLILQKSVVEMCRPGGWMCSVDGWILPPITLETEYSAVVNMAVKVDGEKPLSCSVALSRRPSIHIRWSDGECELETWKEVEDRHTTPTLPGALICACLVAVGVGDRGEESPSPSLSSMLSDWRGEGIQGLEIRCHSSLPHGSGLGTSSILAAGLLACLWRMRGREATKEEIVHQVLFVEQLLTTGGGWQDQVGGIYPGVKEAQMTSEGVEVRPLALSPAALQSIQSRLCLIYTGGTRLAKNLLQEVMRGWWMAEEEVTWAMGTLQGGVGGVAREMERGRLSPPSIRSYMECKCALAAGCEPDRVKRLRDKLSSLSLSHSSWLCGAGGGGFLAVWMEEGVDGDKIREQMASYMATHDMSLHSVTIDEDPFVIECEF